MIPATAWDGPTLAPRTVPVPDPGPGELRIAVRAAGVNRADLLQRRGLYPAPPGASEILGLECAGIVEAAGPGSRFAPGDRVAALLSGGGYATHVVVPDGQALPVPSSLSDAEAAALPEGLCTAFLALHEVARIAPGERVVWHAGASGIGTIGVQVLRADGHPTFVTCGSDEKVARCVALGAQAGWNRRRGPFAAAARAWGGADVVVDPVGHLPGDQEVLAEGGRIVVLAFLGGREVPLDLARLVVLRQTVTGVTLRSRSAAEKARIVSRVRDRWWPHVASGSVRAILDRVLPMSEADAAHQRLASDESVGKVVLALP